MTRNLTPFLFHHYHVALISTILLQIISNANSFGLLGQQDRFRLVCPADVTTIQQFEPSLVVSDVATDDASIWVAVYRKNHNNSNNYNNNQPSILVRDEFLQAMNAATSITSKVASSSSSDPQVNAALASPLMKASLPVAVARLRPVQDEEDDPHFVLDALRCVLVKEIMDPECDGGSEHTEALAMAIDGLVQHYLDHIMTTTTERQYPCFEGSIRAKATLFSAPLLEARGFVPVTELNPHMLTHTSSLEDCFEQYAARAVHTNPGIRQRTLAILQKLGQIDRTTEQQMAQAMKERRKRNDDDDYNPWANSFIN